MSNRLSKAFHAAVLECFTDDDLVYPVGATLTGTESICIPRYVQKPAVTDDGKLVFKNIITEGVFIPAVINGWWVDLDLTLSVLSKNEDDLVSAITGLLKAAKHAVETRQAHGQVGLEVKSAVDLNNKEYYGDNYVRNVRAYRKTGGVP